MDLSELALECGKDSESWFPETAHNVHHHLVALFGELGEFANMVKKVERGTLELNKNTHLDMVMELVDAQIYLASLFYIFGINPQQAYEAKRAENLQRFGNEE